MNEMIDHVMTSGERMCLHSVARDLHTEFRGIFSEETIRTLLFDCHAELAANATVTRWLVLGAEQLARQQLQAIADTQMPDGKVPGVPPDGAVAWPDGSEPALGIDPRSGGRDGLGKHRHLGR